MRRVIDFLRRNWALRLGAILLATVLYTGLVLGQNVRTWTGEVPIERIRQPPNVTLVSEIPPITLIRYRAPIDVLLSPNLFAANVDLSGVASLSGGLPIAVPVTLVSLDQRVQIVDFQPRQVQVQLDPVAERTFPVTVELGTVPDGVTVGSPQVEPGAVTLRGAASRVESVNQVVARISIDASALNVDRDVDLVAVDGNGNPVPGVEIDPERVRVRVAVALEVATRTLPVLPVLTGAPAAGYLISAISVEPLIVTLSGEAATIGGLEGAPTVAINVDGNGNPVPGVEIDPERVRVRVAVALEVATRTLPVVPILTGAPAAGYLISEISVEPLIVTLSGESATIGGLEGAPTVAINVEGRTTDLEAIVNLDLPEGVSVNGPEQVKVVLTIEPQPTPAPTPTPSSTP